MKWFLDITTRSKLYVSFGLIIALLGAVIAVAHRGITEIHEKQETIYLESFANVQDLLLLRANQDGVRAALLTMMAAAQRSDQEAWNQDITGLSREMAATMRRLQERNRDNPRLSVRLDEFNAIREAFVQTRETIIPLIYSGKTEQARALALGIQDERYRKMRAIAQEMGNGALEQARAAVAESDRLADETVRRFALLGIAAILLAGVMALFMDRILAGPRRALSAVAQRVASGDLTGSAPR
ncbi:MAG: MCP four helix bundle domain-containing protein [Nitrosomonadales bacterium]|nr:MCP four helix bundle domain-containing protein [Nitrosomonadales bacterium]